MRILSAVVLVALCLGTLPKPAHATTVVLVDVQEQGLLSTAVVHARVVAADPVRTPEAAYVDTQLQVLETLSGSAPPLLVVRQIGGTHEGVTVRVPGDARLEPGTEVVAFVREVEGRWYLTAMSQSVWAIQGRGPEAVVLRELDDVSVLERALDGSLQEPTQSLPKYTRLSELKAAVSRLAMATQP